MKKYNGSKISPCIISQVRYELNLKEKPARNNKKCSDTYWNEVVNILWEENKSIDENLVKQVLRNSSGMPRTV